MMSDTELFDFDYVPGDSARDDQARVNDLANDLANALLAGLVDQTGVVVCRTQLHLRAAQHLVKNGWAEQVPEEPGRGELPTYTLVCYPHLDEIIDFERNPNFDLADAIEANIAKADSAAADIEKNLLSRIRPKGPTP